MPTTIDLIRNSQALNVESEAVTSIQRTEKDMAELNREQLAAGFDAQGDRLMPYRSRDYAEFKHQMNPEPGLGNPDLILTGAFVHSLRVRGQGKNIIFHASDIKADDLLKKYGDDVLGLSDRQQEYYNEDVFYPVFSKRIENKTGLKMK